MPPKYRLRYNNKEIEIYGTIPRVDEWVKIGQEKHKVNYVIYEVKEMNGAMGNPGYFYSEVVVDCHL